MRSRGRILFGLALGFLVPLLWLGFRAMWFDDGTVTGASFNGRSVWLDGVGSALLGWLVGSVFAGGLTLRTLGELFSDPEKMLQPAIANLVGSRLWQGTILVVLAVEVLGILYYAPLRLPNVAGEGFAWCCSGGEPIEDDAKAQRQVLDRIGAYSKPGAGSPVVGEFKLATVRSPSWFGHLETVFSHVKVVNNRSAACASLEAGLFRIDRLLDDPCLAAFRGKLAAAIAAGERWEERLGGLDLAVAPGEPPILTIKQAGVIADERLDSLLARWQTQGLLTPRDERLTLEEAAQAIGAESLTERLVDRATKTLLSSDEAWKQLRPSFKAARLSSLLRLIASCRACSLLERSRFLDQLADPVRAKLARQGPRNAVIVTDPNLAIAWGRIAGWWADELRESKVIDVALASLWRCGAPAHAALLDQMGTAEAVYLEPGTKAVLGARVLHYVKQSSPGFCQVVVAKARIESEVWRNQFIAWMTAALEQGPECDLRSALYGAAGGGP